MFNTTVLFNSFKHLFYTHVQENHPVPFRQEKFPENHDFYRMPPGSAGIRERLEECAISD